MVESSWSVPESDVLVALGDLLASDREGVLATVVDVEGSAYRRPGAKMVVPADGGGVGSITAGCLEDEVLRLAADVLEAGDPRIETFDLMGDDDVWGLGVGCNGIIDLLLEPVEAGYGAALDRLDAGESVAVATVLSSADPDVARWSRGVLTPDGGGSEAAALPAWLRDSLADPVAAVLERGDGRRVTVEGPGGAVDVFVDGLVPPPELVVFGTGHDVDPIVDLAARNGFDVTVVGFRGGETTDGRFERASTVRTMSPRDVREDLSFDADTYAVVATHNFVDDQLAVDELVRTDVPYVGLMGPRERFEEIREAIAADGSPIPDDALSRLYTPVGLDLGGRSPAQIATSVVAEVLAVHNDRDPRHLSERSGPIHDRPDLDPA